MADPLIDAAKPLLLEAVKADQLKDHPRAVENYLAGIDKLMEAMRCMDVSDTRKKQLHTQISNYMTRAETLKCNKTTTVEYMETRKIVEDSIGHGYDKVFAKVIDDRLQSVHVYDAYVTVHHQLLNFVRLCELLVSKAPKLSHINLTTSEDGRVNTESYKELEASLKKRKIELTINYKKTLHDREIRFDNGWMVKIGRGLDYFKPGGKYAVGALDMNLRPCKETTIDLFKMQ